MTDSHTEHIDSIEPPLPVYWCRTCGNQIDVVSTCIPMRGTKGWLHLRPPVYCDNDHQPLLMETHLKGRTPA
jgi:hypothetical protein